MGWSEADENWKPADVGRSVIMALGQSDILTELLSFILSVPSLAR